MISIKQSQNGQGSEIFPEEARRIRLTVLIHFILALFVVSLFNVNALADNETATATNKIPRDPMAHFFHQSFNDLVEELDIVADENKKGIFIMFSDKDCPWCEKMKATIMNQVVVQDYYRKHFRILTIDIRGDAIIFDFDGNEISEKDFAFKQHRVRATPVVMFFDTSGKKIMRYTGIVRNVKEFLWLGEYVVSDSFQEMNFTKYKRNRKQQKSIVSVLETPSK